MTDKIRLRILYLMRILHEQTDEVHPLTNPQIVSSLKSYGIDADRRAIYNYLNALRTFGIDIIYRHGTSNGYYIGSRTFELPELKLVADLVQSNKFITRKKSEQLVQKLQGLTSKHNAKELSRQIYIANRVKSPNEQIYYNVDALQTAISDAKEITFQYQEYKLDKKLHPRRKGELYHVSPYLFSWDDENYYLIAWHDRYSRLAHFRVDKMVGIEITEQASHPLEHPLDAAEYAKRTYNMFAGKTEMVQVWFDASLIGVVIDRFGDTVAVSSNDKAGFICTLEVAVSTTFLAWLFQFGDKAKDTEP